ncbi:MAG: L,D-transpeptidase family protein, partial [Alphaproteobacteria bacterium]
MSIQQLNKNQVVWQNKIFPCQVGCNGFTNNKYEGDGCTPIGKWKLLKVYYRSDRVKALKCALPKVAITPDMGWSDDTKDPLYNSAIKLPYDFSHEKLWRDDHLYDLLITINHNTNPVIPGQGSAIFIHQMHENETPTAGCLALKLADLEYLVSTITTDT